MHTSIERQITDGYISQIMKWQEYDVRLIIWDGIGKATVAIAKHGQIFVASTPHPDLVGPDLLDIAAEFEYIALFADRSTDQWQYRFNLFSELAGVA